MDPLWKNFLDPRIVIAQHKEHCIFPDNLYVFFTLLLLVNITCASNANKGIRQYSDIYFSTSLSFRLWFVECLSMSQSPLTNALCTTWVGPLYGIHVQCMTATNWFIFVRPYEMIVKIPYSTKYKFLTEIIKFLYFTETTGFAFSCLWVLSIFQQSHNLTTTLLRRYFDASCLNRSCTKSFKKWQSAILSELFEGIRRHLR